MKKKRNEAQEKTSIDVPKESKIDTVAEGHENLIFELEHSERNIFCC